MRTAPPAGTALILLQEPATNVPEPVAILLGIALIALSFRGIRNRD